MFKFVYSGQESIGNGKKNNLIWFNLKSLTHNDAIMSEKIVYRKSARRARQKKKQKQQQ